VAYIRISQAGACPRRLQLEAWGVEGLPLWEGSERAFAEGNLHEPSILEWAEQNLPGGPYSIEERQKEVYLDNFLVGHIDGLGRPIDKSFASFLVEAKCLAARGFQELREKGVREAHPQYYTQVQLYLAAIGLNRAYLVARNKETPRNRMWDMHYEEIVHDPAFVTAEIARLKKLIAKIEAHEDIDSPYNPQDNWQCLSLETEVLTKTGWKTWDKFTDVDEVLTFNIQTGKPEWQKPCMVFVKDYSGKMYKRTGRNISFCITADHKLLVRSSGLPAKKHPYKLVEINKLSPDAFYYFTTSGKYSQNSTCQLSDSLIALSAWITAEGTIENGLIRISQNENAKAEEIRRHLDNLGLQYHIERHEREGRNTLLRFTLNRSSSEYIMEYHGRTAIAIPAFVWELNDRQFETWLDALLKGDGHINNRSRTKVPKGQVWSAKISQRDHWVLDELQVLCALHGYSSKKSGPYISTTGGTYYTLTLTKRQERKVKLSNHMEVFDYDGKVWCVTVPNGTIFTRYNGTVVVLGNCRPPWCPYTYHCHPDYRKAKAEVTNCSDLIATVETLQELNEEIKVLEEFRNEVKARLLKEAGSGPVQAGRWLVQVKERRSERFDTKLARKELPADVLAKLIKVSTYQVLDVKEVE